jgi:SMI1 / KNR4 family (SUKH-1)
MAKHWEFAERIARVAAILIRRGVASPYTIRGCSTKEIAEIEAEVGRKLPLAYREFLMRMGRGAGEFYVGSNLFYPDVLGISEAAHALVAEDEAGLVLPQDAVVFIMHQGYQFVFMRADEGEDPSVYYYMERSGEFVKKAAQLSQFLIDVAHDEW